MINVVSNRHKDLARFDHVKALPWWCDKESVREPRRLMQACPLARATSLVSLPGLAGKLGLASIRIKDETSRLGFGNFKALGGVYAVMRIAERRASAVFGRETQGFELVSSETRAALSGLTVCCASDGNHGRSVAAGARLVGMRCVVFLHGGVSARRESDIRGLGADVVRVAGDYEDSVSMAAAEAERHGWTLVADTARPEDQEQSETCGFVMQGYSLMVDEMLGQCGADASITHLFVQAGVGGLAASVFGHWTARSEDRARPRFIVVEPERSACLLESARAGAPVRLSGEQHTVMTMLECQSSSLVAWPVVSALTDLFMAVTESEALGAVERLSKPDAGDPVLHVGASGATGLAGLIQAAQPANRRRFGLDARSDVLLIATEDRRT